MHSRSAVRQIPFATTEPPAPRAPAEHDWRILVVDEAPPVRKKLLEILELSHAGKYHVASAADAEAALEAFALSRPNIVLTELVGATPEEGLAMIGEMLAIDHDVRIILVTAEDPEGPLVRQAVRRGVFGVVQKPLRHEKIRQLLQEIHAEESGLARFR